MKILNKIIFVLFFSLMGASLFASQAFDLAVPVEEIVSYVEDKAVVLFGISDEAALDLGIAIHEKFADQQFVSKIILNNEIRKRAQIAQKQKSQEPDNAADEKIIEELSIKVEQAFERSKAMFPSRLKMIKGCYAEFQQKKIEKDIASLRVLAHFFETLVERNKAEDSFSNSVAAEVKQKHESQDDLLVNIKSKLIYYLNHYSDLSHNDADEFEKIAFGEEIVELIAQLSPDSLQHIDENQNTLLILAARARCAPATQKLIKMGARNFSAKNSYGKSVLNYANDQIKDYIKSIVEAEEKAQDEKEEAEAQPLMNNAAAYFAKKQKSKAVSQLKEYVKRKNVRIKLEDDIAFAEEVDLHAKKSRAINALNIHRFSDRMSDVLFKFRSDTKLKSEFFKRLKLNVQESKKLKNNVENHANHQLQSKAFGQWKLRLADQQKARAIEAIRKAKERLIKDQAMVISFPKHPQEIQEPIATAQSAELQRLNLKDDAQHFDEKRNNEFIDPTDLCEKREIVPVSPVCPTSYKVKARAGRKPSNQAVKHLNADRKNAYEQASRVATFSQHSQAIPVNNGEFAPQYNTPARAVVPVPAQIIPSWNTVASAGIIAPVPQSRVTLPVDFNHNLIIYDAGLVLPAHFLIYHHNQVAQYFAYLRSLSQ